MSAAPAGGIRHVVCLTWAPGTDADAVDAIRRELARLPGLIPEIRAYAYGADRGLAGGNGDFAIVADFDDAEAWRRYQEHPAHVRVLTEQIRPHLAARTAVQFRMPSSQEG